MLMFNCFNNLFALSSGKFKLSIICLIDIGYFRSNDVLFLRFFTSRKKNSLTLPESA